MTTRVLQVLGRSAGGIARHVARIVADLDGVDGLAIDVAGPPDLPVSMGKPVLPVTIPPGVLRGHLKAVRELRRLATGCDVIHAHGLRAGIDAGLGARRSDARVLVSIHNIAVPQVGGRARTALQRRAEPLAVNLSHRTFAASAQIADHLKSAARDAAGKVEVLYLGVEPPPVTRTRAEVRAELGWRDDDRLVTTVARLAPQKALDVMIGALTLLPDDVGLAIVGDGPLERDLRAAAERRGVSSRVRFLGFRNDVGDYLAAADVFALSSVWEACALAAQEAVALGIPVVATDVGGMRELIEDRSSGRLVPSGDEAALATALAEILDSPELGRAYTDRALEHLRVRFSTERMVARLRDAYVAA